MLTDQQLDDANAYGEWLRLAVHERELPANDRVRASGSCLAIAQDHHHAIIVLLGARLYASSFALVRIAFEAYVRGEWLDLCASAADIRRGSTPFPRTVELRVAPRVAAVRVSGAAGDCANAQCSQRCLLAPRLASGSAVDSPALV